MTQSLSGIRIELLQQHEALRHQMRAVRDLAHRCKLGELAVHAVLNTAIAKLAEALQHHNAREDELLRGVIPTIDAWGPARAEVMSDAHVREHVEVYRALGEAGATTDARAAAQAALRLLDRIAAHMEREEKEFLGEDVLNDDGAPRDSFGG